MTLITSVKSSLRIMKLLLMQFLQPSVRPSLLGAPSHVRFEVLTAASMKMAVFWVVAPCIQSGRSLPMMMMMEAVSTSETSVNF
jgi:hypothetical protein